MDHPAITLPADQQAPCSNGLIAARFGREWPKRARILLLAVPAVVVSCCKSLIALPVTPAATTALQSRPRNAFHL